MNQARTSQCNLSRWQSLGLNHGSLSLWVVANLSCRGDQIVTIHVAPLLTNKRGVAAGSCERTDQRTSKSTKLL